MKVVYPLLILGLGMKIVRAQVSLPASSPRTKKRRLKKKKTQGQGQQQESFNFPPQQPTNAADQEPDEYLPPITDGAGYDDDDPTVHILLSIDELETGEFPSFMESSLSYEQKALALQEQAASLEDDLTIDGVIPEIQSVAITCKKSVSCIWAPADFLRTTGQSL